MNSRCSLWASLIAVWLLGCSGSAPTAKTAERETDEGASAPATEDEEAGASDEAAESEAAPPAATCNDSTCFECGRGLCPSGFYCDEGAGNACSWLPDCAREPSCSCVTRVLGKACSCTEKGGGLHVSCG